jgi:hypothetical protein
MHPQPSCSLPEMIIIGTSNETNTPIFAMWFNHYKAMFKIGNPWLLGFLSHASAISLPIDV